jgi:GTP cyclohydrolase I
MEQKNRSITWTEIKDRVSKLDRTKKYYGVPRGGQYIAALLNPVDTPEEADIIIDDLIDSGTTKLKWESNYPDKPFIALYNKQEGDEGWLEFPWELKGDIEIEENVLRILEYFDNANREGLKETPKRYIKFLKEFLSPPEFNFTTFDAEGTDEMIVQKQIPFYSLCEHHLAPFFGVAHVAYIPNGKIVGLSKLARCVDLYSRGFQNQERITTQIADRLMKELDARGVAVVLEAQHLCMSMRGVKKPGVPTITSKMVGLFKDDLNCRNEFLNFIAK